MLAYFEIFATTGYHINTMVWLTMIHFSSEINVWGYCSAMKTLQLWDVVVV